MVASVGTDSSSELTNGRTGLLGKQKANKRQRIVIAESGNWHE
jgi:hypothetical protein